MKTLHILTTMVTKTFLLLGEKSNKTCDVIPLVPVRKRKVVDPTKYEVKRSAHDLESFNNTERKRKVNDSKLKDHKPSKKPCECERTCCVVQYLFKMTLCK